MKTCANPECGRAFQPTRAWQLFCSKKCCDFECRLRRLRVRPRHRQEWQANARPRIFGRTSPAKPAQGPRRWTVPLLVRRALILAGGVPVPARSFPFGRHLDLVGGSHDEGLTVQEESIA